MNRKRYLALAAESAMADGRPVHEALEAATKPFGTMPREQMAIAFARDGKLPEALTALNAEPLVAMAARVRPEAAARVSRRLADFPRAFESLAKLEGWFAYLAVVFAAEGVGAWTAGFIVRNMERDYPYAPVLGPVRAALATTIAITLALSVFARLRGRRKLREARAAAAAGALLDGGASAPAVAAALRAEGYGGDLPGLVESSAHDPASLSRMAELLHARADASLARMALRIRTGGIVLALVPAVMLLLQMYGWMSGLALNIERAP